jgi:hypothetical protein
MRKIIEKMNIRSDRNENDGTYEQKDLNHKINDNNNNKSITYEERFARSPIEVVDL